MDLLLRGLSLHDLVTLLHHISVKDVRTWDIDSQNDVKDVWQSWVDISSWSNSLVDERALRGDSKWVKNEEGIVSQPGKDTWVLAGESERKVPVANDLSDGVGEQHGAKCWAGGEVWEWVNDAPSEKEAGGDLHDCGHDWSADDTYATVSYCAIKHKELDD